MAAPADDPDQPIVDSDVWHACAVPLSRLPVLGSQVYYFPHGHAEQCPAPLPAPHPTPHVFPCTVTSISFGADAKTNEVFADISLQPGPHRGPPSSSSAADANNANTIGNVSYFAKQLTPSDANNGGGFSVPRYCADLIFPKLDLDAEVPVQNLVMRDTTGNRWTFRHIYRGTPRRHLLTTGWSKFVNAKLLVKGDTVVFMRRHREGDLLIGLRREPRYPILQDPHQPRYNARAVVPPERVMEAVRRAAEGSPFTVTYFPRLHAGEFVVPRKEVEDAITFNWEPGMLLSMQVMETDDARRTDCANATVNKLHAHMWRPLEVDWDKSAPSSAKNTRFLNAWQVQFAGYAPLLKRFRTPDSLCSRDDSMLAPPMQAPIPVGMQGARHEGPTHVSSAVITTQMLFPSPVDDLSAASEILDPEFGSPPTSSANAAAVQTRTIQLFGTTITAYAVQSDKDDGSEEVNNEVPDGVVDENVG